MQVRVILPTLNERENVIPLIAEILRLPETNILVVDDQSDDGTAEAVAEIARQNSRVQLIVRQHERGLTSAIQRGIDESLKAKVICWMDVDFSHPPQILPLLYSPILKDECDVVLASRFMPESLDLTSQDGLLVTKFQKILSRTLSSTCAFFLRVPEVSDWTSGFVAIRSDRLKSHRLIGDYGEYFMDLMCALKRSGAAIHCVPYTSPPRKFGYSKTATSLKALFSRGSKYLFVFFSLLGSPKRTQS